MTFLTNRRSLRVVLMTALVFGGAAGCGGDDDVMMFPDAGGSDAGGRDAGGAPVDAGPPGDSGPPGDAGPPTDGGSTDAGMVVTCPALAMRTRTTVSGDLTADTHWTCDNLYVLTTEVFLRSPAVLTIDPGVVVQGDEMTALGITRGARIAATGTAASPIVFTSSKAEGMRSPGDWGGLVLLGSARINFPGDSTMGIPAGENQIEGITPTDSRARYGGTDDASSCGTLRYARIEWAGFLFGMDNELNGLTTGACGSGTDIEYVQVHRGKDDGVEMFGGTANLRHIVVTGAADDSLDWDEGWVGKVQFFAVQQNAAEADTCIEADNLDGMNDVTPRSSPTIYNATLIGTNDMAGAQRGMVLRRGTAGSLHNLIVTGSPREAIDVRDASTVMQTTGATPALTVAHSLFFQIGAAGTAYFPTETGTGDDDGGFDESAFFMDAARSNRFGMDPMIASPFDLAAPGWVPAAGSPAATGGATPPSDGFFDAPATYVGAFAPGSTSWTAGWTAYPTN